MQVYGVAVADTGGLQWFQLKPPLKIACALNLFSTRRVVDKITMSYTQCTILGLFLLVKLHSFALKAFNSKQ